MNKQPNMIAAPPAFPSPMKVLTHFKNADTDKWKKLGCPATFAALELPTADVFLVDGRTWISRKNSDSLRSDLRRILRQPTVVRFDIEKNVPFDDLLLPTSNPLRSLDDLMNFVSLNSTNFLAAGVEPSQWAVLLAQLVPARVSAMVHAFPYAQRVRVDSLWGFPDGLSFFPYDTSYCTKNSQEIARHPAWKGTGLFFYGMRWKTERIGPPFDWSETLAPDELVEISRWALRVATALKTEVQLMVLCRIGGYRGPAACLPWHFTCLSIPEYRTSLAHLPLQGMREVRDWRDLSEISVAPASSFQAFHVHPTDDCLRDAAFLGRIGEIAHQLDVPILFEGSLLGHAYYLLSRAGAPVVPIRPREETGGKIQYGKLVRDRIKAVVEEAGGVARVRSIDPVEGVLLLKQKLLEEAFEVWFAHDDDVASEIADVAEVLDSLVRQLGLSHEEIAAAQNEKRAQRGGFENLVVLEETFYRTIGGRSSAGELPLQFDSPLDSEANVQRSVLDFRYADGVFRVSCPLIPPVRKANRIKEITAANSEFQITAKYSSPRLILSVQPRAGQPRSMNQLSLFNEEAEEPEND